jgi:hypothetical protein
MDLSYQPTNHDAGILDIILWGNNLITPSLDNLWGQWKSGVCNIITRAFKSLKMVSPFA